MSDHGLGDPPNECKSNFFCIECLRWRFIWINRRVSYERGIKILCENSKFFLYGLKQSPMVWYYRIDLFFINKGFCRSQNGRSLYIKLTGEYLLVATFHMDDLIILAGNVT